MAGCWSVMTLPVSPLRCSWSCPGRGVRWRRDVVRTSAMRTQMKKKMPVRAAMRMVAQSFSGPVMYCWLKLMMARPSPSFTPPGPLPDDGADDGRRGSHLEGREEVGHRGRQADLAVDLPPRGRVGPHQLQRARIGRAQAASLRDGHREERQVRGDDDDRRVAAPRGGHDDGRQGHDGDGLAGDDVGHEGTLRERRVDEDRGQPDADEGPQREADDGLRPGREGRAHEVREQRLSRSCAAPAQRGRRRCPRCGAAARSPACMSLEGRSVEVVGSGAQDVLEAPRVTGQPLERLPDQADDQEEGDEGEDGAGQPSYSYWCSHLYGYSDRSMAFAQGQACSLGHRTLRRGLLQHPAGDPIRPRRW